MRKFINIVNHQTALCESIDFHPAVLKQTKNGTLVDYPDGALSRVEENCPACDGTGKEDEYDCWHCNGHKTITSTKSSIPEMNVSNHNAQIICAMLSADHDYSGYVEPFRLPSIRNRLLKIQGGDNSMFTRVSTDTRGSGGAQMIDMGVDANQARGYVDRLLSIVNWAIENKTGLSWA